MEEKTWWSRVWQQEATRVREPEVGLEPDMVLKVTSRDPLPLLVLTACFQVGLSPQPPQQLGIQLWATRPSAMSNFLLLVSHMWPYGKATKGELL